MEINCEDFFGSPVQCLMRRSTSEIQPANEKLFKPSIILKNAISNLTEKRLKNVMIEDQSQKIQFLLVSKCCLD